MLSDARTYVQLAEKKNGPIPKRVDLSYIILYGCGDFINDYEGIRGYEQFRADLVLMYFVMLDTASGDLVQLRMTPMQLRKLRLNWAAPRDIEWLAERLARISTGFGSWVEATEEGNLFLRW